MIPGMGGDKKEKNVHEKPPDLSDLGQPDPAPPPALPEPTAQTQQLATRRHQRQPRY